MAQIHLKQINNTGALPYGSTTGVKTENFFDCGRAVYIY